MSADRLAPWVKPVHADDPWALAVEVRTVGLVIIHQRHPIRRGEFREITVTGDEVRAILKIIEADERQEG